MQRQQFISDNNTVKTSKISDGFAEADNASSAAGIGVYDGETASDVSANDAEQSIELEQYSEIERFLETEQSAEVQRITAAMQLEVRARHKRNVLFTFGSVLAYIPCFYLLHLIGTNGSLSVARYKELVALTALAFFGLPTFLLPLLMMLYNKKAGRRTRTTTFKIDGMEDLTLVGPLAEILAIDDLAVRRMAKANLTRLLPQLKASDSDLLNAYQRKQLNRFVRPGLFDPSQRDIREIFSKNARQRDALFQIAILNAYEQVGDADCLPFVNTIAHPTVQQAKIVPAEAIEAANHCLPFLVDLAEQDRANKQLLRPSSASDVLPDTLLRPAMHRSNEEDSDSLLRAAGIVKE